jgi:hypothetical protein
MSYQGILKDSGGDPVEDSVYSVIFRIFDAESGGTSEWTEILPCTTSAGYFTALFSNVNIPFDEDYWLELEVDSEILTPRQKITMVGYSARSDTSDYATAGGGWVDDGLNVRLEASYTSSPSNKLHVTGSESVPILNVEQNGSFRATRFYSLNACALWVEHAGNHGLRITNANGDGVLVQNAGGNGIHVDNANGWAGYFDGKGYFEDSVGIGTITPSEKLDVLGSAKMDGFKMPTGASNGYVLTSDGSGTGTWQAPSGGSDSDWVISDTNMYSGVSGNVGIGTSTPSEKLEIDGNLKMSGKATIGSGNFNYGDFAFVAGLSNIVNDSGCVISGGKDNDAFGYYSTISGGYDNYASSNYSSVGGGYHNFAYALGATVAGGYVDSAVGNYSTIGGGQYNYIYGDHGTISGGMYNTVNSQAAAIGGGENNSAGGNSGTIGGGELNTTNSDWSIIGGGHSNEVYSPYGGVSSGYSNQAGYSNDDTSAYVGGGFANQAYAKFSTVAGGSDNTASGIKSTVSGGESNYASAEVTTIGGGYSNTASWAQATVSGGAYNDATGSYSVIGGGTQNTASQTGATVAGGFYNNVSGVYSSVAGGGQGTVSGNSSFIGSGWDNTIDGEYSAIPTGYQCNIAASADYSMAFGNNVYLYSSYRVALFDSTDFGALGINRDDLDAGISHPIHVGTSTNNGNGAYLANDGNWYNPSSLEFKENNRPLDGQILLNNISNLTLESWQYKGTSTRHIGPYAEEFNEAFGVASTMVQKIRNIYRPATSPVWLWLA